MAKKSYETFYNVIERNFYSTMNKLSVDKCDQIKDDFLRENFWWEGVFGGKVLFQNCIVGLHFTLNMEDVLVRKN